ncbi:MAG: DUF4011 domain-containing protein, partial [Lachnospiraceae bacterium]|nr:DUF4011 domain-containing protein [Lachnospiraceae bacterium]
NLINFRDTKASSAEVVFPDCESVFAKCTVGHTFEVYDPKIAEEDIENPEDGSKTGQEKKLDKTEYKELYSPKIKSERYLLMYAQTPNPLTAVKSIAKKAKEMQDETGINVAYLAFGFIKWTEKAGAGSFFLAPLLLIHVNILTGSIVDPVKIEIRDDDVVVNPTFSYLLQADYGLSLPPFQDGDTLSAYYEKVSSVIRKMNWEVVSECKLGIFSFLKINMYEDLKANADQILENRNIQALLGEAIPGMTGFSGEERIVENPLIDLHTVVEADSSQIGAIEMAKSGKSFVLQGPPGTGKSQTITNIIAECLHDGKKVLFVSEKQAALNVVFDKLKKAGLADFCLELHSHKANKRNVIEELNRTMEVPRSVVSASAQEEIRQKGEAQGKLDGYAAALHEKREPIGKSLYQLFEAYSAQRDCPELPTTMRAIETKGQDYFLHTVKLMEQYAEYIPSVGQDYRQNIWYGFNNPQLGYDERNQLQADLETVSKGYRELQETSRLLKTKYEIPELNFSETARWQSLLAFLAGSDVAMPALLTKEGFNYALPYFKKLMELSGFILPVRERVLTGFSEEVIRGIDGRELYAKLTGQYNGLFSRMFSGEYKNLIARLQSFAVGGRKLKYQEAVSYAEQLMNLQSALKQFEENESRVQGFLGSCYRGPDTDWQHVMSSLAALQQYFGGEKSSFGLLPRMNPGEFAGNRGQFQTDSMALANGINKIADAKDRVARLFDPQHLDLGRDSYDYCIKKLEGCAANYGKLGNWISFMGLLKQLENADLSSFIELIITNQVEPGKIAGTYRRAFSKHWIEYILFSVPELAGFSRIKHDQTVQHFAEKDSLQYEISKIQIKSELSQKRPDLDMVAGGSAVAILRREGQKKRKQMPIRKLLAETGSLVQIIKPCFLMSPLSVSTFLEPEKIAFDTVVFDEASQMFPQDAIGAIYRGKQLIVVGDSMQMPPSNFFSASSESDDEDEEIGDIGDFESILDICSSVFNTERLAWHYRSHYEQLIAFSNMNFYNNNLVTFPSSSMDREGIGVDYHYVNGIFDRKSKTNRAEAEYIVELVCKNIEEHPERSLGVVAFSVAQQNLIDKLLSKKRENDPAYEWFFKGDRSEPFFVKNLETVQGDERDTIIFSVAYAKDSQGRFIHNFGPLNREGGERRLNVAITRAKDNVQLVASIHSTDINLSSSGSEGVRLLRAYLDYAQHGEQALERALTVPGEDHFDSDFEQEVCDYLRAQGFTVDMQVGCSGYKIDMGVRMPESSNYVLAVECDGATYHSAKNARDRDSIRQRVLENMGWQFYRIWSTDWYKNKTVEKANLVKKAKEALENSQTADETSAKREEAQAADVTEDAERRFAIEEQKEKFDFPKYKELDAVQIVTAHGNDLQGAIREILETEAPLSEEFLLKRIVSLFGREKVTKAVLQDYESKMYQCERRGIFRKDGFLTLQGMESVKLRVPGDKREIKHIPIEELADGMFTL